jgi:eukaryotic-like serine/threonine-protein kinase
MAEIAPWIVAGRYEVGEIVGRGGYGMVRRALDRKTGQTVAMKVLSADAGKDPHLVERMLREQQAMVAMAGTCAVSVVDLCRLASGAPCLIMEWLEGRDLERQLTDWESEGQRASIPWLLETLRPLTDTLQRAHELGIVHRDIKPANIFLTSSAVRLLDFGLSRMRSAAPLTAVGMVMGSPSYIPPETWRGNSALIDHRADLYSLAVIVFRALAWRLPFETPSLIEKLKLVTTGERPSVCALRPDLPPTVDVWMKRALAIEPEQRFQSARDFYDALTLALSGTAPSVVDDEVSGVRAKASAASVLRAENRNVLTLAWERATSLLQRFIGQKAAQSAQPLSPAAEPEVSREVVVHAPDSATETGAAQITPLQAPVSERPSVAWLDDNDVEDLPESVMPAPPQVVGSKAKPRSKKKSPKATRAPSKKARGKTNPKPAKAHKKTKSAASSKKTTPKKSKATSKKR